MVDDMLIKAIWGIPSTGFSFQPSLSASGGLLTAWDSGLKVNFNKSLLTGVNLTASWLSEVALAMNCRVGALPFVYLGLPIGGHPRKLDFWKPILTCIHSRLLNWKSKFLSFGGRLVLLKYVLSSLPVYFLSFFKAPTGIISSIESLFKIFFGGWRGF